MWGERHLSQSVIRIGVDAWVAVGGVHQQEHALAGPELLAVQRLRL